MENQLRTPCFSINGNTITWATKKNLDEYNKGE